MFPSPKIVLRSMPMEVSVLKDQSQLDLDEISEDLTETVKDYSILPK